MLDLNDARTDGQTQGHDSLRKLSLDSINLPAHYVFYSQIPKE